MPALSGTKHPGFCKSPSWATAWSDYVDVIYVIGPVENAYKIGMSRKYKSRIVQIDSPIIPALAHLISCSNIDRLEAYLHVAFHHRHARGEWFFLMPNDIAELQSIKTSESSKDLPAFIQSLYAANSKTVDEFESIQALRRWRIKIGKSRKY